MARKKASLGCLFWTALILLILVVFLFNRAAIQEVLDRTELVAVLQRSVDNLVGRSQPAGDAPPLPEVTRQPLPLPQAPAAEPEAAREPEATPIPEVSAPAPAADRSPPAVTVQPDAGATQTTQRTQGAPGARRERPRRLFFATVSAAGDIAVTSVTRTVDHTASPLTDTLEILLAGPDTAELNQGLITLIPSAAALNGVYVSDRIAYVDVSESFRFNRLGREGLEAQLQQIVFSATEFPSVDLVQILIEGERVDFLGPEGTFIGEPIGRRTFQ